VTVGIRNYPRKVLSDRESTIREALSRVPASTGGLSDGDKGDITVGGGGTTLTVDNNAVTYAKVQDVSAASRLLGRGSAAGAGDPEEISLGANLSMAGTVLSASGGAGSSATTVESNLGSVAKCCGKFTITDAAIGATSKVLCWQAPGPYTGKGTLADEATMQPVSVVAVAPAAGSAVVHWQTPPGFTMRNVGDEGRRNLNVSPNEEQGRYKLVPQRVGMVRGNVKFSYMVLA
jgi:hypothetical protein